LLQDRYVTSKHTLFQTYSQFTVYQTITNIQNTINVYIQIPTALIPVFEVAALCNGVYSLLSLKQCSVYIFKGSDVLQD